MHEDIYGVAVGIMKNSLTYTKLEDALNMTADRDISLENMLTKTQ